MSNFITENLELLSKNYFFLLSYFIFFSCIFGFFIGLSIELVNIIKRRDFTYIKRKIKIIFITLLGTLKIIIFMKYSDFFYDFTLSLIVLALFSFLLISFTNILIDKNIQNKIEQSYDHTMQCKKINRFLDTQIKNNPTTIYSNTWYFRHLSKYPICKILLLKDIYEDVLKDSKSNTYGIILFLLGVTMSNLIPEWPKNELSAHSIIFMGEILFIGIFVKFFIVVFNYLTNNPSKIEKKINMLNYYIRIWSK